MNSNLLEWLTHVALGFLFGCGVIYVLFAILNLSQPALSKSPPHPKSPDTAYSAYNLRLDIDELQVKIERLECLQMGGTATPHPRLGYISCNIKGQEYFYDKESDYWETTTYKRLQN